MQQYTLVVVDMQPGFPAANNPGTLAAVAREIEYARQNHCPVIFLEISYLSRFDMEEFKPTHIELTNLLSGYDRCAVAEKLESDGSWAVLYKCRQHGFTTQRFRICGVNTDACIKATVQGLAKSLPDTQIDVVQDACNTSTRLPDWNMFTSFARVNVVGASAPAH